MKKQYLRAVAAILSFFSLGLFANAQVGVYAVRDARIVTVSGAEIPKGTVVIRDGLIESVGVGVKIPADARVFDGSGLTIYPGLFDAATKVGIPAAPTRRGGGQPAPGQSNQPQSNSNYPAGLRPEIKASDKLKAGESQFKTQRGAGITTALTVGEGGIFNGQSAVINLAGKNVSSMIVRSPYALHITFRTLRGGQFPTSLMGTFAALRQMFLDARRLDKLKKMYSANPAGMRRPPADASLEALIAVVRGDLPVVLKADSEREIIRALDLGREFGLKTIISGGREAWKAAERLKKENVTVLLSLDFPKRTLSESKEAEPESLETLRLRANVPKNAARLAKAGVRFAFQSGGLKNPKDFLTNARVAVENGLDKKMAVRTLTLTAAEILGVQKQLGSVDAGKIANLLVVKGDLLDKDSSITQVFVDGKLFEQPKKPAKKPGAPTAAGGKIAQVAGEWNLVIEPPGQTVDATITFVQQGSTLTGTLSSDLFASTPIRDGKATADGFSFSVTISVGGTDLDVTFDGTVTGNEVEGTVDTPQGPAAFRGTRNP